MNCNKHPLSVLVVPTIHDTIIRWVLEIVTVETMENKTVPHISVDLIVLYEAATGSTDDKGNIEIFLPKSIEKSTLIVNNELVGNEQAPIYKLFNSINFKEFIRKFEKRHDQNIYDFDDSEDYKVNVSEGEPLGQVKDVKLHEISKFNLIWPKLNNVNEVDFTKLSFEAESGSRIFCLHFDFQNELSTSANPSEVFAYFTKPCKTLDELRSITDNFAEPKDRSSAHSVLPDGTKIKNFRTKYDIMLQTECADPCFKIHSYPHNYTNFIYSNGNGRRKYGYFLTINEELNKFFIEIFQRKRNSCQKI